MEKNFKLLIMLFIGIMTSFTLSCDSDDDSTDNGNNNSEGIDPSTKIFSTPKYANEACRFEVTDTKSAYESFELTESGMLIVTMRGEASARSITRSDIIDDEVGHTGHRTYRYEKVGDLSYKLYTDNGEYWGTLKVVGDQWGSSQLPTDEGGTPYAQIAYCKDGGYPTNMQTRWYFKYADDYATKNLCRSWKPDIVRIEVMKGNSVTSRKEFKNFEAFQAWQEQEFYGLPLDETYPEDIVSQLIFTYTGTFLVFIADGHIQIGQWIWPKVDNSGATGFDIVPKERYDAIRASFQIGYHDLEDHGYVYACLGIYSPNQYKDIPYIYESINGKKMLRLQSTMQGEGNLRNHTIKLYQYFSGVEME